MGASAAVIHAHLERLEDRIVRLSATFMSESNGAIRNDIQREINALQIALEHYKSALAIEEKLAAPAQRV